MQQDTSSQIYCQFFFFYKGICARWGNILILCVPLGRPAGGVSGAAAAWAHLRGWWMCWLMCCAGGSLGTQGWGFWCATWAAAGVKSLSP